jgi:hypothetical protein
VVDGLGELEFGVAAEPDLTARRFIKAPEFAARWQTPWRRAYAIVQKPDLPRYFATLPHTTLAENPRYLLRSHEPAPPN